MAIVSNYYFYRHVLKSCNFLHDLCGMQDFYVKKLHLFVGGEPPPRSLSTRIMAGFWWLFVLIVVSTYTANLTAFLTVKRLKHPVTSLDDLASQTKVKYGIVNHGSLYDFFKSQIGVSLIVVFSDDSGICNTSVD